MRRTLLLLGLLGACDDGGARDAELADATLEIDVGLDAGLDSATPDVGVSPDGPLPDAVVPDAAPADGPLPDVVPLLPGADDLTAPVPEGFARAGRVDTDAERLTGPDGQCRVGCFRLDNAHLSLCIQDEGQFSQFTFQGGNLVDAHLAERPGTDIFDQHIVAPGAGEVTVERVGIVADGADGGPAVIRVEGRTQGMRLLQAVLAGGFVPIDVAAVTEYRLHPDARAVEIETRLLADDDEGAMLLADVASFGDRSRALALDDALMGYGPGTAFAWRHEGTPLNPFVIDILPVVFATHGEAFFQVGAEVVIRRALHLGVDVEALRRPVDGAHAVTLLGPEGAVVRVDGDDGPVTVAVLADGARAVQLAAGTYRLTVEGWPTGEVPPVELTVEGDGEVEIEPPVPARLAVTVEDPDGRALAARVRVGGAEPQVVVGAGALQLPAGERRVTVTRGWHFSVFEAAVELRAGEVTELAVVLEEVLPTPGWSGGEFHQHASPSVDSTVTVEDRVLDNLGEGVGFMVPSDHDVIYDYAGLVERMGVGDHITVPLTGVEISPINTHIGAYGIPFDPAVGAGGSPPIPYFDEASDSWKVHTVADLVVAARERGARVIQMNHPRDGTSAYFDAVRLDAEQPVEDIESVHWTTDFDSVEVFNDDELFCRILADWMGLLNQGLRVTAIGNSDTHGARGDGFPRNYIPTRADFPHQVTGDEVATAVLEGRTSIGGAAFLDLPDGPPFGDTVGVEGGAWDVRVRVQTPPWTAMRRLVAFHNGRVVLDRPLEAEPDAIVDIDEILSVPVDADGPVVWVAIGDGAAPYGYDPVFALGNPVWVDVGGDGVTPPGPGPVERLLVPWCDD